MFKADDAYSPPPSATPALNAESVVDGLLALIRSARQDLLVVSPYFVGYRLAQVNAETTLDVDAERLRAHLEALTS